MGKILITGGTGSLGQALVGHLLDMTDHKLVVLSRDEQKQAAMAQIWPVGRHPIRYLIGDVRDQARLVRAMEGVDWVIHAAAMKIVPTCEHNPWETILTNVVGTWNVVTACIQAGVEKAILVSSDKGVNPVNLYGATKLCAEKLMVRANVYRGGIFCAARYGNVMGSRGSVLHVFRRCVQEARPFPITDERMTRFWLTIDQAVEFVLSSLEMAIGGEVFVPKLRACRIVDLANALRSPGVVVPSWEIIGIRPGEKLNEILVSPDERPVVDLGHRLVVLPAYLPRDDLEYWHEQGQPWPEGTAYASDTCPLVSEHELHRMVHDDPK